MGGGGLVILPKKSWNVWNKDNLSRVRRDKEKHAKTQDALARRKQELVSEVRLLKLRGTPLSSEQEQEYIENGLKPENFDINDYIEDTENKKRKLEDIANTLNEQNRNKDPFLDETDKNKHDNDSSRPPPKKRYRIGTTDMKYIDDYYKNLKKNNNNDNNSDNSTNARDYKSARAKQVKNEYPCANEAKHLKSNKSGHKDKYKLFDTNGHVSLFVADTNDSKDSRNSRNSKDKGKDGGRYIDKGRGMKIASNEKFVNSERRREQELKEKKEYDRQRGDKFAQSSMELKRNKPWYATASDGNNLRNEKERKRANLMKADAIQRSMPWKMREYNQTTEKLIEKDERRKFANDPMSMFNTLKSGNYAEFARNTSDEHGSRYESDTEDMEDIDVMNESKTRKHKKKKKEKKKDSKKKKHKDSKRKKHKKRHKSEKHDKKNKKHDKYL